MKYRVRPFITRTTTALLVLLLALSITTLAFAAPIFTNVVVDNTAGVGEFTSVAVNSSGNAVISYYDHINQDLKLAVCNDAVDCDSPTITTVDSANDVGKFTSLVLDSSDRPIISYYDDTADDLKLAFCNDATCTSSTITVVHGGPANQVGQYSSLALDSAGRPVISYYDYLNLDLRLAICNDAVDCDSPFLTTVDGPDYVGQYSSLALTSSDLPIISYYDMSHGDLKLAICMDPNCAFPILRTIDTVETVGTYTSLEIDASGRPIISYQNASNSTLKIAFCNDGVNCASPIITTVDSTEQCGWDASLELTSSGIPVISYSSAGRGDYLKLATCNNAVDCGSPILTAVDGDGMVGWYTSLALDSNDNPVISHNDQGNMRLRLALPVHLSSEISVSGYGAIADGDTTPNASDGTDFGSVAVASGTAAHTFTITNSGTTSLMLGTNAVSISGPNAADFNVTAQPATSVAAGGGTTTFEITFDPSATGTRTAEVAIANDDANESPYNFAIQGTGTAPEIDVQGNGVSIANGDTTPSTSDRTDFGSTSAASGTVTRTFTIANTGSAALTLGTDAVSISGTNAADFSVSAQPATSVAASGSTTFQITFDPSAAGTRTATVSIANNDANESPYTFAIKGVGTAPEIKVLGNGTNIPDGDTTPDAADDTDFGSVDAASGSPVSHTFTVENTGSATLTLGVDAVSVSGTNAADFSITAQPATSVAANNSTTFEITFDPSALGTRTAAVSITNDDPDENPFTFAIQGTGTETPAGPTFNDVPTDYWAYSYIEAMATAGVTSSCGGGNYCPDDTVTRAQMAVFLVRAKHGTSFTPPAATGIFDDVPTSHWAAAWIEQLASDGVTSGCGGGNYCPENTVTRAQMAVFLELAKRGASFTPPDVIGMFDDVPTNHWAAAWIEQLASDGITSGCGGSNYCPDGQVTRAQMAVFLVKTFNLPMP